MKPGKRKFHFFHKFSGYVLILILLTVCFLQYAKAASPLLQQLMEQSGLKDENLTLIQKFWQKFRNSLNIKTDKSFEIYSSTQTSHTHNISQMRMFGDAYAKVLVKTTQLSQKYGHTYGQSLDSVDATLSFLKRNKKLLSYTEKDKLNIDPTILFSLLEKKTDLVELTTHTNVHFDDFLKEIIQGFILGPLDVEMKETLYHDGDLEKTFEKNMSYRLSVLEYATFHNALKNMSSLASNDEIRSAITSYFTTTEKFLSQLAYQVLKIGNGTDILKSNDLQQLHTKYPNIITKNVIARVLERRVILQYLNQ